MPQLVRLFRGGDDHLQSGIGRLFEQHGFRLLGPKDIAPELLMPPGELGAHMPGEQDRTDIARGLALLNATSPFDIGQAAVVANNQVLALEGPEGTDQMLARVAELRRSRRINTPIGTGVLIKAAKLGQDQRIDLPVIGPPTVEAVSAAGLAGIAVVDDRGVLVNCSGQTTLSVGQAMTCTGAGVATLGQYSNVGKVTAASASGSVDDSDASHYLGVIQPSVTPPPPGEMTICHIPPGNYNARSTITIGVSAWPAHQGHCAQGTCDYIGACR